MSLIGSHTRREDIAQWTNVSQLENVLHTEELDIISVASGYLNVEPFCVPDLNCQTVGYLVYHCCSEGSIHSFEDDVICHVFQHGPDTCVKLDCWELNSKQSLTEPAFCWIADPCKRLYELRCCQMEWLKAGKKKDWSWRDSSGSTSFLSESCLKDLIAQAEIECDAVCGNTGSRCMTYSCSNGYC